MSQILAIDYGTRKIGFAISDETLTIASRLPVVFVKNESEIIESVQMYLGSYPIVDKVLIGLPLGIDLKPTQMSNQIKNFSGRLSKKLDKQVEIAFTNEVLSTSQAEKGKSRKFKKDIADSEAARIFLQEYLDHNKIQSSQIG